jgi:hypothetical protein
VSVRHWAVVCGKVRDPGATLDLLGTLGAWRREGLLDGIVLSTWLGEVVGTPGLARALHEADVTLVESPEPSLRSMGHVHHQMKSLGLGLAACPDDVRVFKLRTDKLRLTDAHADLLRRPVDLAPDPTRDQAPDLPVPLEGRIWAAYCHLRTPFWLGDVAFLGHVRDLRRLVHFDAAYDAVGYGAGVSVEIRFFSHPFLAPFPIFTDYLRSTDPVFRLRQTDDARSAAIRDFELGSDWYLRVLASYHLVLRRCFVVGFPAERDAEAWCVRTGAGALPAEALFDPVHARRLELIDRPGTHNLTAVHDAWLGALHEGRFRPSAFGERYGGALAEVGRREFHSTYDPSPLADAVGRGAFVEGMQARFGLAVPLPRRTS